MSMHPAYPLAHPARVAFALADGTALAVQLLMRTRTWLSHFGKTGLRADGCQKQVKVDRRSFAGRPCAASNNPQPSSRIPDAGTRAVLLCTDPIGHNGPRAQMDTRMDFCNLPLVHFHLGRPHHRASFDHLGGVG